MLHCAPMILRAILSLLLCYSLFPLWGESRDLSIKATKWVFFDYTSFVRNLSPKEKEILSYYQKRPLKIGAFLGESYSSVYGGESYGLTNHLRYLLEEFLEIQTVEVPYEFSMEKTNRLLQTRQVDIIPNLYSHSLERLEGVLFTEFYFTEVFYLYGKEFQSGTSIQILKNKNLGLLKGNFNRFPLPIVDLIQALHPTTNITTYYGKEKMLQDMANGTIDYILGPINSELLQKGYAPIPLDPKLPFYRLHIATRTEGDGEVLYSLLNRLTQVPQVEESFTRYHKEELAINIKAGRYFSPEDLAFIASTKERPILFANINPQSAMQYFNPKHNTWQGAQIAIWERIIDLSGLTIRYNVAKDINSLFVALGRDSPPLVDGTTYIPKTDFSEEFLNYLPDGTQNNVLMVGLSSTEQLLTLEKLPSQRVGIVQSSYTEAFVRASLPALDITKTYKDIVFLAEGLRKGEVDVILVKGIEFTELFYNLDSFDLQVKGVTPISINIGSALAKKGDRYKSLERVIYKSLLAIDPLSIINQALLAHTDVSSLRQFNDSYKVLLTIMGLLLALELAHALKLYRNTNIYTKDIKRKTFTDLTTGLKNRLALENTPDLNVQAFYYVIVANLKDIEDLLGSSTSKKVLLTVSQRLKLFTSAHQYSLFLLGEGEFAILDPRDTGKIEIGQDIEKLLQEEISTQNSTCSISPAVGIVSAENGDSIEDLILKASMVLSMARQNRDSKVLLGEASVYKSYRKRQLLQSDLSKPLMSKMVLPFYQPKYDALQKRFYGAEALARWSHRDMGMLYPDEFIPILEESKRVSLLDQIIAEKTCKDLARWLKKGLVPQDFVLSSNFSIQSLETLDMTNLFKGFHETYGVPYKNLEVEVTETIFSGRIALIQAKLQALRELGIKISLDDFSSGHAGITRLASLPIDVLKVDKALIAQASEKILGIFKMLRGLAEKSDLQIIIEGVETREQEAFLYDISIYRYQGYYYSKPLPAQDLLKRIAE